MPALGATMPAPEESNVDMVCNAILANDVALVRKLLGSRVVCANSMAKDVTMQALLNTQTALFPLCFFAASVLSQEMLLAVVECGGDPTIMVEGWSIAMVACVMGTCSNNLDKAQPFIRFLVSKGLPVSSCRQACLGVLGPHSCLLGVTIEAEAVAPEKHHHHHHKHKRKNSIDLDKLRREWEDQLRTRLNDEHEQKLQQLGEQYTADKQQLRDLHKQQLLQMGAELQGLKRTLLEEQQEHTNSMSTLEAALEFKQKSFLESQREVHRLSQALEALQRKHDELYKASLAFESTLTEQALDAREREERRVKEEVRAACDAQLASEACKLKLSEGQRETDKEIAQQRIQQLEKEIQDLIVQSKEVALTTQREMSGLTDKHRNAEIRMKAIADEQVLRAQAQTESLRQVHAAELRGLAERVRSEEKVLWLDRLDRDLRSARDDYEKRGDGAQEKLLSSFMDKINAYKKQSCSHCGHGCECECGGNEKKSKGPTLMQLELASLERQQKELEGKRLAFEKTALAQSQESKDMILRLKEERNELVASRAAILAKQTEVEVREKLLQQAEEDLGKKNEQVNSFEARVNAELHAHREKVLACLELEKQALAKRAQELQKAHVAVEEDASLLRQARAEWEQGIQGKTVVLRDMGQQQLAKLRIRHAALKSRENAWNTQQMHEANVLKEKVKNLRKAQAQLDTEKLQLESERKQAEGAAEMRVRTVQAQENAFKLQRSEWEDSVRSKQIDMDARRREWEAAKQSDKLDWQKQLQELQSQEKELRKIINALQAQAEQERAKLGMEKQELERALERQQRKLESDLVTLHRQQDELLHDKQKHMEQVAIAASDNIRIQGGLEELRVKQAAAEEKRISLEKMSAEQREREQEGKAKAIKAAMQLEKETKEHHEKVVATQAMLKAEADKIKEYIAATIAKKAELQAFSARVKKQSEQVNVMYKSALLEVQKAKDMREESLRLSDHSGKVSREMEAKAVALAHALQEERGSLDNWMTDLMETHMYSGYPHHRFTQLGADSATSPRRVGKVGVTGGLRRNSGNADRQQYPLAPDSPDGAQRVGGGPNTRARAAEGAQESSSSSKEGMTASEYVQALKSFSTARGGKTAMGGGSSSSSSKAAGGSGLDSFDETGSLRDGGLTSLASPLSSPSARVAQSSSASSFDPSGEVM